MRKSIVTSLKLIPDCLGKSQRCCAEENLVPRCRHVPKRRIDVIVGHRRVGRHSLNPGFFSKTILNAEIW